MRKFLYISLYVVAGTLSISLTTFFVLVGFVQMGFDSPLDSSVLLILYVIFFVVALVISLKIFVRSDVK